MRKRARKIVPTPKPPRRSKSSEEDAALNETKDFLDSIMREGKATWFSQSGRNIAAVWIQEISQDIAREWINRVDEEHQRNRTASTVKRYCTDILNNNYIPAIPMLIFDRLGRLINGQHILKGFIDSSTPALVITVQVNLHERAYQAPDQNKKRSVRDTLKWSGVERSGDVASVITVLFQYLKGYYSGKGYMGARAGEQLPSNAEGEALQKRFPEIQNHLWKSPSGAGGFSLPALRAASVVLANLDPELHKKFFAALISGVGITDSNEPVAVLRNAILRAHHITSGRGGWRHGETMLRVFKTWNHYVRGEAITGGLYRKGEVFQEPLGSFPVPESSRTSSRVH